MSNEVNVGCETDEFCNNAKTCQKCIDALDLRDFTRDTIGYNQFDELDMKNCNDGEECPEWDGELSDILPPLCLDSDGRDIICIG